MDYARQSNKEQPFEGLSLEEKKRLWVYMCHIAHPSFTPEVIERKWGKVLRADELPTVFSALEIVQKIKEEIRLSTTMVRPRRRRTIIPRISRTTLGRLVTIICLVVLLVGLLCYRSISAQKEKDRAQKEKDATIARELIKIDEEFGRDTVSAYNHLLKLEKYSNDARCRRHLFEVFGIGTDLKKGTSLSNCPIHGNCLERAVTSKAFCKGFSSLLSSLRWCNVAPLLKIDDDGLKPLREECRKIPQLKKYDIILLERIAELGDIDAIKELAECYSDGVKVTKNDTTATLWYSRYIEAQSDLEELNRLRSLFSVGGRFPNDDLLVKVSERLASRNDLQAILWLGNYWYDKIYFQDNWNVLGRGCHFSHRWDKMPCTSGKEYKNAEHWLELAASNSEVNSVDVFLKLSLLHAASNNKLCVNDLRSALKFGSEDAAFELGVIYEKGLYEAVANKAEAKRLYLIAANKGHSQAQLSYAYLFDSPKEAWNWVFKAANQGNVEAQYQYGRLNDFYGWGAWGIDGTGWKDFQCACDYHHTSLLKKTIVPGSDCGEYQKSAIVWYRLAAKNGHKGAERELAKHNATLE